MLIEDFATLYQIVSIDVFPWFKTVVGQIATG